MLMAPNSSRKKATHNQSSCRPSSPSRCPVLSGVGRNTSRVSVSYSTSRRRSSSNNNNNNNNVRLRAPRRLPHPPIFRTLSGLWAGSTSNYNSTRKDPPLCLPSPRRRTRTCLCTRSTFLKRRPRGRIETRSRPHFVSVLCHSLTHPPRLVLLFLLLAYLLLTRLLYIYPPKPLRSGVVNTICLATPYALQFFGTYSPRNNNIEASVFFAISLMDLVNLHQAL